MEGRHHGRRPLTLLIIVAAALGACSGLPDVAALKRMTEASLRVPGSVDLFHSEAEAATSVEGSTPAFVTAIAGTNLAPTEAMDFLRRSLEESGWQVDPVDSTGIRTTAEDLAEAWRKGDTVVRLSVLRKDDPRNPVGPDAGRYTTIYQISLFAKKPVHLSSQVGGGVAAAFPTKLSHELNLTIERILEVWMVAPPIRVLIGEETNPPHRHRLGWGAPARLDRDQQPAASLPAARASRREGGGLEPLGPAGQAFARRCFSSVNRRSAWPRSPCASSRQSSGLPSSA